LPSTTYILEKIDKEASKEKRSRSEYVELHFETLLAEGPQIQSRKN
jgi:hypothetical protein